MTQRLIGALLFLLFVAWWFLACNDVRLSRVPPEATSVPTVTPIPSPTGEWTPKAVSYDYDISMAKLSCPEADARTLFDVDSNGYDDYVCIWSCATYDTPPFAVDLAPGPDHVWIVAYSGGLNAVTAFWGLGFGGMNHCFPATESNYYLYGEPQP